VRLKPQNLVPMPLFLVIISLFLKGVVVLLVVYIATSYLLAGFSSREFSYRINKPLELHASILLQPIMDIFAYSKVSHFYDYSEIEKDKIPQNILPLSIRTDSNFRKPQQKFSWSNTRASLGGVTTAVIVEPADYSGKWSLVYCLKDGDFCEQSNIFSKGKVKLIADGDGELWGKDEGSNFIQLKLIKYTDRSNNMEILHI